MLSLAGYNPLLGTSVKSFNLFATEDGVYARHCTVS